MEKEIFMPQAIWEGLKGRKLILAGNDCELRQRIQENLVHMIGSLENSFEVVSVTSGPESRAGGGEKLIFPGMAVGEHESDGVLADHYVFLFAYPETMDQLQELLDQLQELAAVKPRAAVLISDNRVYGKLFGDSHPLKTDEIGYACHTMPEDIPVTNLRTAEHYACRLAREEELNIRVARADASRSGEILVEMTEAAVRVLLEGTAGAVYNLPMHAPDIPEARSPLTPIPIITATGK